MRPKRSSAALAMASTAGASTTSATAHKARPPFASISFTTASPSARVLRTLTPTAAPPAASSSAMARPMLRPEPVMMATRPLSSWSAIELPSERGQIDLPAEYVRSNLQRRLRAGRVVAAVARVEQEFVLEVFPAQRLVRPAAHVRLALLDHAAVAQGGADMTGEIVRIRIVRINPVADFFGERDDRGLVHRGVGEIAQAHIAADEARGDAIGLRELAGIAVFRRLLGSERLPEPVHSALADVADHFGHVVRLDATCAEPPCAIDVGMRHGPAGIELEGERLADPARAEVAGHGIEVALGGVGEAVKEAVRGLQHRARPGEAGARQQGGAHARLRGPTGMHALGPGAFGEIFDDA